MSRTNFGNFNMTIGNINWLNLNYPKEETKIHIQFWGDHGPGRLVVPCNANQRLRGMYPNEIEYEIRCNIWHFHKYLIDMQDIVLQIVDKIGNNLAYVPIKLFYLIKDSVSENDKSVFFRDLKGLFPIMHHQSSNKVGEIEVNLSCNFYTELNQLFSKIAHDDITYTPEQIEDILNDENQLRNYLGIKNIKGEDRNNQNKQVPSSLLHPPQQNQYNAYLYEQQQEQQNQQEEEQKQFQDHQEENNNNNYSNMYQELDPQQIEDLIQQNYQPEYQDVQNVIQKNNQQQNLDQNIASKEDNRENYHIQNSNNNKNNINNLSRHKSSTQGQKKQRKSTTPERRASNNSKLLSMIESPLNASDIQMKHRLQKQKSTEQKPTTNNIPLENSKLQQSNNNQKKQQEQQKEQNQGVVGEKLDKILQLGEQFLLSVKQKDQQTQFQQIEEQEKLLKQRQKELKEKEQQLQQKEQELQSQNEKKENIQQFKQGLSNIINQQLKQTNEQLKKYQYNDSDQEEKEEEQEKQNVPLIHGPYDNESDQTGQLKAVEIIKQQDKQLKEQDELNEKIQKQKLIQQTLQQTYQNAQQQAHMIQQKQELKQEEDKTKQLQIQLLNVHDIMQIRVIDFKFEDGQLLKKFLNRPLFIQIYVPELLKNLKIQQQLQNQNDQIQSRTIIDKTILFNQDIKFGLNIDQQNFDQSINSNLRFVFNTTSVHNQLAMELGSGEFNFGRLVNKAPEFQASYNIKLYTRIPQNKQQQDPQQITNKTKNQEYFVQVPSAQLIENKEESYLGSLRIDLKLKKSQEEFEKQQQQQIQQKQPQQQQLNQQQQYFNPLQPQQPQPQPILQQNQQDYIPQKIPNQDQDKQIFQLFLKIGDLTLLDKKEPKNLFARYKIYGTPDEMDTEIFWNATEADFDHTMMLPISKLQIQKMAKVPFMIQIWHKQEGKDTLIGVVKINLKIVAKSVLKENLQDYTQAWKEISQSGQLIVLKNGNIPCLDLKGNKERGYLFIHLVFGNAKQINQYQIQYNKQYQQNKLQKIIDEDRLKLKEELLMNNQQLQPKQIQQSRSPSKDQKTTPSQQQQLITQPQQQQQQQQQLQQENQQQQQQSQKKTQFKDPYAFGGYDLSQSELINPSQNLEIFIDIMEQIRKKSDKIGPSIQEFLAKDKQIQDKQFYDFLLKLDISVKGKQAISLIRILDYTNDQIFNSQHFAYSYSRFVQYEEPIRQHYQNIISDLLELLNDNRMTINLFERKLNQLGELGYVKRHNFTQNLRDLKLAGISAYMIQEICELLDTKNDQFLFTSYLTDYLRKYQINQELKSINLSQIWFQKEILNAFQSNLKSSQITLESIQIYKQKLESQNQNQNTQEEINQNINIEQFMEIFNELFTNNETPLSFWESLFIIDHIKQQSSPKQQEELENYPFYLLPFPLLQQYLSTNQQKNQPQTETLINKSSRQQSKNQSIQDHIIIQNNSQKYLSPNKTNQEIIATDLQRSPYNLHQYEHQDQNQQHEEEEIPEELIQNIQSAQHKFSLKLSHIESLNLDDTYEYLDFYLQFNFPNTQDLITTKLNEYELKNNPLQKYLLDHESLHTYTLPLTQPLDTLLPLKNDENYPQDKLCNLQLIFKKGYKKHLTAKAKLQNEEFLNLQFGRENPYNYHENLTTIRIPLYSTSDYIDEDSSIIGILVCDLLYMYSPIDQRDLQKQQDNQEQQQQQGNTFLQTVQIQQENETIIQKHIPKRGYINLQLKSVPNDKAIQTIIEQHPQEFSQGYFLSLQITLFHSNQYLENIFDPLYSPPFFCKLSNILEHTTSQKITLNPDIIHYFQETPVKFSLKLHPIAQRDSVYILGENNELNLVSIFLQENNNNFTGEISLTNPENIFAGILSYNISYDTFKIQDNKKEELNQEEQLQQNQEQGILQALEKKFTNYILVLQFNEILSYLQHQNIWDSTGLLYFELTDRKQKQYQSTRAYSIDFFSQNVITLQNNHIFLDLSNNIDDILPLEICVKILKENQNTVHLGFLSINLDQLFAQQTPSQPQGKYYQTNQYFTLYKDETLKTHETNDPQKIRININLGLFAFENQDNFLQSKTILKNLLFNPSLQQTDLQDHLNQTQLIEYLQKKNSSSQEQEIIKNFVEISGLTSPLLTRHSLQQKQQILHITNIAPYLTPQDLKKLYHELQDQDTLNQGFLSQEPSKSILQKYHMEQLFQYFQVKPTQICTNTNKLKVTHFLDYLQLQAQLDKIILNQQFDTNYALPTQSLLSPQDQSINFQQIYEKMTENLKKYKLQIYIKSGQFLDSICQKLPNSYIKFPEFNFSTQIQPRQYNPFFFEYFQTKSLVKKLEVQLFERKYSVKGHLQDDHLVARGYIDLQQMMTFSKQTEGKKMEFQVVLQRIDGGEYLTSQKPLVNIEIGVQSVSPIDEKADKDTTPKQIVNHTEIQKTLKDINIDLQQVNPSNIDHQPQQIQQYPEQQQDINGNDMQNVLNQIDNIHERVKNLYSKHTNTNNNNNSNNNITSNLHPQINNLSDLPQQSSPQKQQIQQQQEEEHKENIKPDQKNNNKNQESENPFINHLLQDDPEYETKQLKSLNPNNKYKKTNPQELERIQQVMHTNIDYNSKFDYLSSDSDI